MPQNGVDCLFVSGTCILHSHGDYGTSHNAGVYDCHGVVVDLCDVVDQIISFVDIVQTALVNELNQLWYLVCNVLLSVVDVFPHDEVFGNDLQKNEVGIALLNGVEAVGNGYLVAHFPVVRLQVHQTDGKQGSWGCYVQVHIGTFFYARAFVLVIEV